MPKILCIFGMVIASLILLIFGLDLATSFLFSGGGIPFRGISRMTDVMFVVCAGILGYLSWSSLREQV
jgi:hypothetical protein